MRSCLTGIVFHGLTPPFKEFDQTQKAPEIIDAKGLEKKMNAIKVRAKQALPGTHHPWRCYEVTADKKLT